MKMDVIDMQSYNSGYVSGYVQGCDHGYETGYNDCYLDVIKKIRLENERRQYFNKQKFAGVLMLAFTVLSCLILDGDATFALLGVPLGCAMIFSKQKFLG